jgi:cold shock protein
LLVQTFRLLLEAGGVMQAVRGWCFARVDVWPSRRAVGAGGKQPRGRSYSMAMTGTVKFFNGERGYGFIKPDDGGRDVFVHITAVERAGLKSLIEGQRISFDVEPDKKGKGPKAVNLIVTG